MNDTWLIFSKPTQRQPRSGSMKRAAIDFHRRTKAKGRQVAAHSSVVHRSEKTILVLQSQTEHRRLDESRALLLLSLFFYKRLQSMLEHQFGWFDFYIWRRGQHISLLGAPNTTNTARTYFAASTLCIQGKKTFVSFLKMKALRGLLCVGCEQ